MKRCSFFFSSRRRHTRWPRDWSSDVCSSDLTPRTTPAARRAPDMCGRFAFFQEIQPLLDDLDAVDLTDGRLRSRWNIPPTTPIHVVTESIDQRSEEHTSELQSRGHLVCRLLLEKKNITDTRKQ